MAIEKEQGKTNNAGPLTSVTHVQRDEAARSEIADKASPDTPQWSEKIAKGEPAAEWAAKVQNSTELATGKAV